MPRAPARSRVAGAGLVLDGFAGERHERVLQRRLLRGQLVEDDAARRAAISPMSRGWSARGPPARRRRRGTIAAPGRGERVARARSAPAACATRTAGVLGGLRDDLGDRSCRRSAGRGRRRRRGRRSARSRSSDATTERRCALRRRGPCSSVRIQRMPSGSRPLAGSSRIDASADRRAAPRRCPAAGPCPARSRRRACARRSARPTRSITSSTRGVEMPCVCAIASRWS